MDTPTRRDLFKYAVGATLASALPVTAQDHRDPTLLQLSVDLTGPMAFTMGAGVVETRLPKLSAPHVHKGAIVTSAGSIQLGDDDYSISFDSSPPPPPPAPTIHLTNDCKVYTAQANQANCAKSNCIHLTLPMPNNIVALSGVPAWIFTPPSDTSSQLPCTKDKPKCTLYAQGLRFLYNKAGTPTFKRNGGPAQKIPLDVAPFENQVIMSISYVPVKQPDDGWDSHARTAFKQLARLFGLNLAIEIESDNCPCKADDSDKGPDSKGAHRPCNTAIMVVTLKS